MGGLAEPRAEVGIWGLPERRFARAPHHDLAKAQDPAPDDVWDSGFPGSQWWPGSPRLHLGVGGPPLPPPL